MTSVSLPCVPSAAGAHVAADEVSRRFLRPRYRSVICVVVAATMLGIFSYGSTDVSSAVRAEELAGAVSARAGNGAGQPAPGGANLSPLTLGPLPTAPPPAVVKPNAMPLGDLPGWHQTFAEDFSVDQPAGAFPGAYASKWMAYDGFPDTSGNGEYAQRIVSAHDGYLDLHLKSEKGIPLVAAPVPLVDGKWGGQTYGRFSVRLRADPVPGYGAALLLWSDANNWNEGEIDFPESNLNQTVNAANHCPGSPVENCYQLNTSTFMSDWHTYTINWTPSRLSFEIDGTVVGSTDHDIPTAAMHWVLQFGTTSIPDVSAQGHVLIDWATIYHYQPSAKPSIE